MKIYIQLSFIILLTSFQIYSQSWSLDLGTFDWNYASKQCKQKGMRLPNISELETAFKSGKTRSWGGNFAWSSTPSEPDFYYVINLNSGSVQSMVNVAPASVRCLR